VEKMVYRVELDIMRVQPALAVTPVRAGVAPIVSSDWRQGLPTLRGTQVVLRELRASDATSLCALLSTEEVARFMSPPPTTVEGFERFITAIGIFQIRETEAGFGTAEWGFAIGSAFWGSGVFQDGAELVLDFAFKTLGVNRLEARAAALNGRGNGALLKVGAVQECILRKSFLCNGQYIDQILYSILESDRRVTRTPMMAASPVLVH